MQSWISDSEARCRVRKVVRHYGPPGKGIDHVQTQRHCAMPSLAQHYSGVDLDPAARD
jgi:hypothetical protein